LIRYYFRQLGKSERGAAMVEFAIIAMLFFALIFGIIEFGWIFNGYITLTSAAQEGARLAIVTNIDDLDKEVIRDRVRDHAMIFKTDNLDIEVNLGEDIGEETEIVVNGKLDLLIAFPPLPQSINLSTTATMRQEQ